MNEKKLTGRWGESVAAAYLRRKGYTILEMGFTCRVGEIDIIARERREIVFVEVKLRREETATRAADAVSRTKQRRLMSAARFWLSGRDIDTETRFDVIEIYAPQGTDTEKPRIEHLEGAFWEK
ncbi:MAG: YraN family protein [bacterium]